MAEKERASCFTLFGFMLLCDYKCSVSIPPCALGYSVINDCGISLSMCGSKKAYQKGLTLITYLVDEGREDPNTTMSQPSMPYQQNAI